MVGGFGFPSLCCCCCVVLLLFLSPFQKHLMALSVYLVLVLTLFRLSLNVASTKLILSLGVDFDGELVEAFAEFVTGGNFVVCLMEYEHDYLNNGTASMQVIPDVSQGNTAYCYDGFNIKGGSSVLTVHAVGCGKMELKAGLFQLQTGKLTMKVR